MKEAFGYSFSIPMLSFCTPLLLSCWFSVLGAVSTCLCVLLHSCLVVLFLLYDTRLDRMESKTNKFIWQENMNCSSLNCVTSEGIKVQWNQIRLPEMDIVHLEDVIQWWFTSQAKGGFSVPLSGQLSNHQEHKLMWPHPHILVKEPPKVLYLK